MKSRAVELMPLALAASAAPLGTRRSVPSSPASRRMRVTFNGETLSAWCLVIDARSADEKREDLERGALKGSTAVFFQGHAQRPTDAYPFTSALAVLSLSGITAVPVCDTPYGTDPAWRGDNGKTVALMEVVRAALKPLGIRVQGCPPPAAGPVLVDAMPVDDGTCSLASGIMAMGWSHGGILARRFAHAYPKCVSALGQVCPAGYERLTPLGLTGRFAAEALRISKITAGSHSLDALRSALGFTRGLTGDVARSLLSAASSRFPARGVRALLDIRDCSLLCDSTNFGVPGLTRVAVAFGRDDTCMSPKRILGTDDPAGLTPEVAERFREAYFADLPGDASLRVHILPGTHLGPVTHSRDYARTILESLGELVCDRGPGGAA